MTDQANIDTPPPPPPAEDGPPVTSPALFLAALYQSLARAGLGSGT